METARIARERGHRVTLVDAADRLGGVGVVLPAHHPGQRSPAASGSSTSSGASGVVVPLGEGATADSIRALSPEHGRARDRCRRGRPDVPGADLPHVHTGDTLRGLLTGTDEPREGVTGALRIAGWAARAGRLTGATDHPELIRQVTRKFLPVGKDVVVIGGSLVGLELAEFFAERRKSVTVLEAGAQLGLPMALPRRWHAVRRAAEHGVRTERQANVEEITPTLVRYRDNEGRQRTAAADLVVIATEVVPDASLAKEIVDRGVPVQVVGDAGEIGYIQGAIHSAWRVVRDL